MRFFYSHLIQTEQNTRMDKHDRSVLKSLNLKDPWQVLAVGFGSGLLPKAPGTYGSLAALPFCMVLVYLPLYISLAFICIFTVIGTIAAAKTEKVLGMHDNSSIVVDEFAGMFVAVLFYPAVWYWCFLAFILFRIFDIFKPFPISFVDKKVNGGFGVMLDDLLAGIYAALAGQFIFFLLNFFYN